MNAPTIVWLRHDLRLSDNVALDQAARRGGPIVPVYILEPWQSLGPGGASRWWLHHGLAALDHSLRPRGSRLVLRRGEPLSVLRALATETGAHRVHWNRRYDPAGSAIDDRVATGLVRRGVDVSIHPGNLLVEPTALLTGAGRPYRVFTPFHRALSALDKFDRPLPAPNHLTAPTAWPDSDQLDAWRLLPAAPDWAGGLRITWRPGEAGARERLDAFLAAAVRGYARARDVPGVDGTSRLSPHLHFGEISPRQVWHVVSAYLTAQQPGAGTGEASYLRELAWREFCQHLLFHEPALLDQPLQPAFAYFPWREDSAALRAWQRGETGYPIVDAGMRQLWQTGWMHNRVRMIVASFLSKHLLVPWQAGAAWFLDTLVDADLANNAAGWQWVAGCGADAQPYFRIFNPVLQGERFDPEGRYVRRYVPELARLPNTLLHKPWTAAPAALDGAAVRLGETYPRPLIDHGVARTRALEAFRALKRREAPQP